jgi:hypothetical protein
MISMIFDLPLPLPYSIPSPVVSVVTMALIEALAHFTLRFPLRFTNPSSYSIPLYAFGSYPIPSFIYEFGGFGTPLPSPLFDSKSSDFCNYYSSYSGFWYIFHFILPSSIYGSLL